MNERRTIPPFTEEDFIPWSVLQTELRKREKQSRKAQFQDRNLLRIAAALERIAESGDTIAEMREAVERIADALGGEDKVFHEVCHESESSGPPDLIIDDSAFGDMSGEMPIVPKHLPKIPEGCVYIGDGSDVTDAKCPRFSGWIFEPGSNFGWQERMLVGNCAECHYCVYAGSPTAQIMAEYWRNGGPE